MKVHVLVLLFFITHLVSGLDARCCRRRSGEAAFIGGVLGALTGATIAATAYCDEVYWDAAPAYDFVYRGAPIYAYDYPTYMYAPVYADTHIRYSVYPSYYWRR